jgi:hypothetical protein
MQHLSWLYMLAVTPLVACAADPNYVEVQLAPEVISSIDGTLSVHALVYADNELVSDGKAVTVTVDYTDRNGTPHAIQAVDAKTDKRGAVDATFDGLTWDGTGTVKATVTGGPEGEATFSVLDRTPPKLTITPPANSTIRINQGASIQVHVTDEIGVSEVFFEASSGGGGGNGSRQRSTVVASGSADATVSFDYQANDTQVGQMVTFYALASDLSSNQAAAAPITVMITQ